MKKELPLFDPSANQAGDIGQAEAIELVSLYESREKIYAREVAGRFNSLRNYTAYILLIPYFAVPWFNYGGRQAVLFDLPTRQFHIFGLTFWPQDLFLLAWFLIIAAFALFFVTVFAGRVWCGYTCPQSVYTKLYMWAEKITEGSRNARIRLDAAPWSTQKFLRKSAKHTIWLGMALATGLCFVGYFTPIRSLAGDLLTLQANPWAYFWVAFFTLATYGNAGWLREQVCIYMCPYARFQSVMFDADTLVVSYDEARGEPRGSRNKSLDYKAEGLGDCINCQQCVQVCPVGIDIRDGIQYECISCAACIDACDSVMDKMGYPRGLVRYSTENAVHDKPSSIVRPRLVGYGAMLGIMAGLFAWTIATRIPLEVNVIRERGQLYQTLPDGSIVNQFEIKVLNMTEAARNLRIEIDGIPGAKITSRPEVHADAGEVADVMLRVQVPAGNMDVINMPLMVIIRDVTDDSIRVTEESRFMGPAPTF